MRYLAVILLLTCTVAYAQTAADIQIQENIQREIQQRIEDERRQKELEDALRRPTDSAVEAPAIPEIIAEGNCVELQKITYSGNTVIKGKELDEAVAPFIKCVTTQEIEALLQVVTNLYIEAGYVTSRAYMMLPQPQLTEGVLDISIVEGRVSGITGMRKSEIFTAFPNMDDQVLYLHDIEQGIDQMNRLSSNNVVMDIKPSEAQNGYSDIILNNTLDDNTSISAIFDNAGSKSTGEYRYGVRLSHDNLMKINDQINLGLTKSFSNNYNHKDSNSISLGLSVPFRYFTFNNNFSYSDYITSYILQMSGERFYSTGDSINNTLSIDYLYLRGQKYKLSASAGYTYKQSNNYMEVADVKTKNEVSSRKLSILYIELPSTFYFSKGVLYVKPGYYQGMKFLGALDDSEYNYSQKAQYSAIKLYSYYSHSLSKGNITFTVDGQYSSDELFGSEAFSIGGESSVRGFKDESASGDMGAVLKAEYSVNLNSLISKDFMKPYRLALFSDWGTISSNGEAQSVSLAGAGATLGANYKYFNMSMTYAAAIMKPDSFNESSAFYMRAAFNYSF